MVRFVPHPIFKLDHRPQTKGPRDGDSCTGEIGLNGTGDENCVSILGNCLTHIIFQLP